MRNATTHNKRFNLKAVTFTNNNAEKHTKIIVLKEQAKLRDTWGPCSTCQQFGELFMSMIKNAFLFECVCSDVNV